MGKKRFLSNPLKLYTAKIVYKEFISQGRISPVSLFSVSSFLLIYQRQSIYRPLPRLRLMHSVYEKRQ